ncbi:hypothetical protein H2201_008335 [Coniosporium apollinis]|uniref:Uncharacterized protein n=1 Tax=Coniosporium apollinis TaxID=61459 RepID=A0ABQ9NGV3_9PEZI|nr:hypothetical protein H2201_008335 [Coniosporium apollinis]
MQLFKITALLASAASAVNGMATPQENAAALRQYARQIDGSRPTGIVTVVLVDVIPAISTSTVYTTQVNTVYSCHPTVTDCPLRSPPVAIVTATVAISTTLCPVTLTSSRTTEVDWSTIPWTSYDWSTVNWSSLFYTSTPSTTITIDSPTSSSVPASTTAATIPTTITISLPISQLFTSQHFVSQLSFTQLDAGKPVVSRLVFDKL